MDNSATISSQLSIVNCQLGVLKSYFPTLTDAQTRQIDALFDLYSDWNSKINVISRKDIENLYLHHVLHSLGILKMLKFREGSTIMDIGTGGGFPGIPLAILLPEVQFHLVDSIGKFGRIGEVQLQVAIGIIGIIQQMIGPIHPDRIEFNIIIGRLLRVSIATGYEHS